VADEDTDTIELSARSEGSPFGGASLDEMVSNATPNYGVDRETRSGYG